MQFAEAPMAARRVGYPTRLRKDRRPASLHRLSRRLVGCILGAIGALTHAANLTQPLEPATSGGLQVSQDLEYRTVLFEYFQGDYFSALVEQSYAEAHGNEGALSPSGKLLQGSMKLSYGMADEAQQAFETLLAGAVRQDVQNRAWFHLAQLHFNKSDVFSAKFALNQIEGDLPSDVLVDFHYLTTLLQEEQPPRKERFNESAKQSAYFPYFLFNQAIKLLKYGDVPAAEGLLQQIAAYAGDNPELSVLADRAKHGLSELAMRDGRLAEAWGYLVTIRTTGLYSNRALLSYGWAAVRRDQVAEAIPALELLTERSLALPEVQEGKVLLAHVYEQNGQLRKALARNINAEKEFTQGLQLVEQARAIIASQDVPREFITNLEAIMDDTDWYAARPSVDYQKLTPFLIDLMSTHAFNEALRELADLYVIEDNLTYWRNQAEQHRLILEAAANKTFSDDFPALLNRSTTLQDQLIDRKKEIELHALVLDEQERQRLDALLQTTEQQLSALSDKVRQLSKVERAYQQPKAYGDLVEQNHARIEDKLRQTQQQILALEAIMRRLIDRELDKHQERINYYLAQSRLAKARLYDLTLLQLERAPAADTSQEVSND